jgi:SNF2 family DNA or RNA helicase
VKFSGVFEKQGAELTTSLRPYQQRVVDKFRDHDLLVAHGVGSGKTIASLAALLDQNKPALVMTPTSLVENYKDTIRRNTKDMDIPIDVTSIGKVISRGMSLPKGGVGLIDEGHQLRNPSSIRHDYIEAMRHLDPSARLMLLSATPAYNRISDIAPLVNLVRRDNALPEDPLQFEKEYVGEEVVRPSWLGRLFGVKPGVREHLKNRNKLKSIMKGYVDYQASQGLEGFPDKIEENIEVPMSHSQYKTYKFLQGRLPWWAKWKIQHNLPPNKKESKDLNAFLQGLRQVSLSEKPYDASLSYEDAAARSPKLSKAVLDIEDNLRENKDFRAFVYSNYMESGLLPMKAFLDKKGIPNAVIHGGLSAEERGELVRKYNDGDLPVLMGSSAASEGLSLKNTSSVYLMDPHFNSSRMNQAVARGIRYKSHDSLPPEQRNVRVKRYVSTIPKSWLGSKLYSSDENILSRAKEKDSLIDELHKLMEEVT